jgi:hypothetical protein
MKGYAHLLKRHRAKAGVSAQLYEAAAALEMDRKLQDELEDEKFSKLQELVDNDNQTVSVLLSEHDESGREIRTENVPFRASLSVCSHDIEMQKKGEKSEDSRFCTLHILG